MENDSARTGGRVDLGVRSDIEAGERARRAAPATSALDKDVAGLFVRNAMPNTSQRLRIALPAWGRFVARAARALVIAEGHPTTIGLTVPDRGYAAALAAAQIVLLRDRALPMAPSDLDRHVAALRALEPGAPVEIQRRERVVPATFEGFSGDGEDELMHVRGRADAALSRFPVRSARMVRIADQSAGAAAATARKVHRPELVRALRGDALALSFVTTTRLDCLIVGTASRLQEELFGERLFVSANPRDEVSGCLQDLVRAEGCAGASRYWRTQLVSSASGPGDETGALSPHTVIFDGGRGYVRWRHCWPSAHQLVVLDRSAPSAQEAAYEMSAEFAGRREGPESGALARLTIPASLEAIAFERAGA